MPILSKAKEPDQFINCLIADIGTLCIIFIFFGEITSLTWGSTLTEPYVTQMLPPQNLFVSLIKVAYTGNLICSYPIMIKPTNEIIESYLFSKRASQPSPSGRTPQFTSCQRIGIKISRSLGVVSAAILGIVLASDMDKFLGFFGALLGSPMAMTFPALIHYNLVARSRCEKLLDILIITLSAFTLVFSTSLSLIAWIS